MCGILYFNFDRVRERQRDVNSKKTPIANSHLPLDLSSFRFETDILSSFFPYLLLYPCARVDVPHVVRHLVAQEALEVLVFDAVSVLALDRLPTVRKRERDNC